MNDRFAQEARFVAGEMSDDEEQELRRNTDSRRWPDLERRRRQRGLAPLMLEAGAALADATLTPAERVIIKMLVELVNL